MLRFDERRQVLATLVQSAGGRVPVIAHVGTPRTRDAVELAKHAEQDGASAVSLVPPYYYKYSREEIIAYYRRVLDAISIPVILYNIPQFSSLAAGATATVGTTVNLQPELFLALRSAFQQGDIARAQRLQQQINEVVEQLVARGVFQSAKYLAAKETVDTGPTREPFVALTAAQKGELDDLYLRLRGYIADAGQ